MKKINVDNYEETLESRFPPIIFVGFWGTLLLMSGIHTGLIVLMNRLQLGEFIQTLVPTIYWTLVALFLTGFTRNQIKSTYEAPMQNLAKATEKVANGDFSVYVPNLRVSKRPDYLDRMIVDFNKMVEELGSIETLKTDFVSNVSHEMKTPIAVIKNYAEMLKGNDVTNDQRKDYAAGIEEAAVKLSNLITNILKLNKLENQRIIPKAESYNVCEQFCQCILQFESKWEEKEIELDIELDDVVMIQADESLMDLVWNNLLSNAIKFTEPGGTISVRQTVDEKHITVMVSDTGCGMSKESLKHIFDKFYQGDTSHYTEGNGLGLALVHRVLQLMDGEIQVDSELGRGSTFTVTLPTDRNQSNL